MYRVTKRARQQQEKFAAMGRKSQLVQAENRRRLPRQIWEPPSVRRVVTITDYDFGKVTHTMELRRSDRIDCYDCYINGELWKSRIGWSRVTEWLRKAMPRVRAI